MRRILSAETRLLILFLIPSSVGAKTCGLSQSVGLSLQLLISHHVRRGQCACCTTCGWVNSNLHCCPPRLSTCGLVSFWSIELQNTQVQTKAHSDWMNDEWTIWVQVQVQVQFYKHIPSPVKFAVGSEVNFLETKVKRLSKINTI
jgi:hypothetical protein